MNSERLYHSIAGTLPDLFECSPAPQEGVRVRTPLMYPDGGIVDVFVLENDGQYRVTDFGETLGWLRMQSVTARPSPGQRRMIEDTCQTLGVELHRGSSSCGSARSMSSQRRSFVSHRRRCVYPTCSRMMLSKFTRHVE